ncbi:hypothetical protein HispidOSU_010856 [Sigmodon hispidus]
MVNSLSTVLNTVLGLGKGSRFSDSLGIPLAPAPRRRLPQSAQTRQILPLYLPRDLGILTNSNPAVLPIGGFQLLVKEHFRNSAEFTRLHRHPDCHGSPLF